MSVVAWDGTTLAADKQINIFGMRKSCTKIFAIPNMLVGVCGAEVRLGNCRLAAVWTEARRVA